MCLTDCVSQSSSSWSEILFYTFAYTHTHASTHQISLSLSSWLSDGWNVHSIIIQFLFLLVPAIQILKCGVISSLFSLQQTVPFHIPSRVQSNYCFDNKTRRIAYSFFFFVVVSPFLHVCLTWR